MSIWITSLEINIFIWKRFEQCVREETAHLATLKSVSIEVVNLLKETADIETGMAEKFICDQANRRQKHGLVGEIERKLAKLSKITFTYRSSS